MAEILFYHLETRSLDDVLPGLVERTLGRGQRALIRADSAERAQAIDNLLWTANEENFLPHAQVGDGDAARQPVLITREDGNPNGAHVLFLVGGELPASAPHACNAFERIVIIFDGRDPSQLSSSRAAWRSAKEAGHEATYWKQTSAGRWEKQA